MWQELCSLIGHSAKGLLGNSVARNANCDFPAQIYRRVTCPNTCHVFLITGGLLCEEKGCKVRLKNRQVLDAHKRDQHTRSK